MSYELLTSLYYGESSNADLVDEESRRKLHVKTSLDAKLPEFARRGRSIVLTGNPGDGKSHLVRKLCDEGELAGAVVELDLSAKPTADIVRDWSAAARAGKPYVLCANQGPLGNLIAEMRRAPALTNARAELTQQLGSTTAPRVEALPPTPSEVIVVDLADRNLLDAVLLEDAIGGVCTPNFLPSLSFKLQTQTSAGRNMQLIARAPEAKRRLAQLLAVAGRRAGGHFTFRHIWGAIAFALTAAKKTTTLSSEYYSGRVGIDCFPLSYLARDSGPNQGSGPLIDAVKAYADPAQVTLPDLDEEIWSYGAPRRGRWLHEHLEELFFNRESPARMWRRGEHDDALAEFCHLKRLVALAHDRGEQLIDEVLGVDPRLPSSMADDALKELAITGTQRLYLTSTEQRTARPWLRDGLCLWVGHTYLDVPGEERAHVAVTSLPKFDFEVLRPQRVPWLSDALGPSLELAWLVHKPSQIALRLEPELLALFEEARSSDGPIPLPERVQRFLTRLAGWEETQPMSFLGGDNLAVLERPRGAIVAIGSVDCNINDESFYAD